MPLIYSDAFTTVTPSVLNVTIRTPVAKSLFSNQAPKAKGFVESKLKSALFVSLIEPSVASSPKVKAIAFVPYTFFCRV